MASATADQVAEAASHIRNVLRTIQRVGNDWNAGVRYGAETELGNALSALGETPTTVGVTTVVDERGHTLVRNLINPNIWHDIGKAATDAAGAVDPAAGAEESTDGHKG